MRTPKLLRSLLSRSACLPEVDPLVGSFLGTLIRHRGQLVGDLYLNKGGREFRREDKETLVMFASQSAMAIARGHRE